MNNVIFISDTLTGVSQLERRNI